MKLSVHWTDNMPSKAKEVNKCELYVKFCNKYITFIQFCNKVTYIIVTILP